MSGAISDPYAVPAAGALLPFDLAWPPLASSQERALLVWRDLHARRQSARHRAGSVIGAEIGHRSNARRGRGLSRALPQLADSRPSAQLAACDRHLVHLVRTVREPQRAHVGIHRREWEVVGDTAAAVYLDR